jgi:hypothetical protein
MHRVRELLIVVVQVGTVKIYVAAVEAIQEQGKQCYSWAVLGS